MTKEKLLDRIKYHKSKFQQQKNKTTTKLKGTHAPPFI